MALTLKARAAELGVVVQGLEPEREREWAVPERAEQRALVQVVLVQQVSAAAPAPLALPAVQVDLPGPGGFKEMQSGPAEEKIPRAAEVSGR